VDFAPSVRGSGGPVWVVFDCDGFGGGGDDVYTLAEGDGARSVGPFLDERGGDDHVGVLGHCAFGWER